MRHAFVFLATLLITFPALAQSTPPVTLKPKTTEGRSGIATPVSPEQADKYYKDCANDTTRMMDIDYIAREMICSCAATGMQALLTSEDVRQMKNLKNEKGRAAYEKMLKNIYFPCSMPVLENHIRQDCMKRTAGRARAINTHRMCGCVVSKTLEYVKKVGIDETLWGVSSRGGQPDPLDILRTSPGYSSVLITSYSTCSGGAF